MNGVVAGGWAFVWAAYVISALALAAFAGRAILRFRAVVRRQR